MIFVLADDLTGAAELAGMAQIMGLRTKLYTEPTEDREADVVVYNVDSRSLLLDQALKRTGLFHGVLHLQPGDLIYKKTDSVLRGYIAEELNLTLKYLQLKRVLFLPANPSLHRTIQNGLYYVNGIALHETIFSRDPEFPRTSAQIGELLKGPLPVHYVTSISDQSGILIPDANSTADVQNWAEQTINDPFLAGAGDFFQEILLARVPHQTPDTSDTQPLKPFVFLAGTSLHAGKNKIWGIARSDERLLEITDHHLIGKGLIELEERFSHTIQQYKKAVIAFAQHLEGTYTALHLRTRMTEILRNFLQNTPVGEVFVEGGSTAQALLENWGTRWKVDAVYNRGVIRLVSEDVRISMKPGSYPLGHSLQQFLTDPDPKIGP
jgi:D-threonate/D-erythronate kinase